MPVASVNFSRAISSPVLPLFSKVGESRRLRDLPPAIVPLFELELPVVVLSHKLRLELSPIQGGCQYVRIGNTVSFF